ncbi:hypothetical protein LMG28727_01168 [Paraburkholderia kirstenboschensis]|nr:hypothetical protein [Paraburkholderia kirstenboschensis]CAD6515617.1 hypothetical protein LMG28727_01168 [Paraburkholderia kirstenboschensis]
MTGNWHQIGKAAHWALRNTRYFDAVERTFQRAYVDVRDGTMPLLPK